MLNVPALHVMFVMPSGQYDPAAHCAHVDPAGIVPGGHRWLAEPSEAGQMYPAAVLQLVHAVW